MNEKELGEALNLLYQMEAEAYQTERLAREANNSGLKYGNPKKFPPLSAYVTPVMQNKTWELVGRIIGMLGTAIFCVVFWDDDSGWWHETGKMFWFIFIGIPVIAALSALMGFILAFIGKQIDKILYRRAVKNGREMWEKTQHAEELDRRTREVEADRQRVSRELEIRNKLWGKASELLNLARNMREIQLRELYDRVGMPEDYRKLITMRYMSDFFNQGISRKMDGTDGLYYLVRKELRADQFNASLQDISTKLDKILSNQTQLYRDLVQMDRDNKAMIRELESAIDSVSSSVSSYGDAVGRAINENTRVQKHIANCIELQNSAISIAMHAHYG